MLLPLQLICKENSDSKWQSKGSVVVYRPNSNIRVTAHFLMVLCLVALAGCASTKGDKHRSVAPVEAEAQASEPENNERDPFERVNRAMFTFNTKVDRYFARPVARGYRRVVPRPVRTGISNFY